MADLGKIPEILTGNWTARSLTPSFVFVGGGLFIWLFSHNPDGFIQAIEASSNSEKVFWVVAIFLFLAIVSGFLEWLTPAWIQLLEGNPWPRCIYDWKVKPLKKQLKPFVDKYRQLSIRREQGLLTRDEKREYLDIEIKLSCYPKKISRLHPTRVGNILRASEEYPYINYGFDFYFVWSHLWLVMPESAQKEINNSVHTNSL